MKGDEEMKKYKTIMCFFVLTLFIVSFDLSDSGITAFAADGTKGSGISKGISAAIMVGVFIVTAVIAGAVSFRIYRKRSDASAEKSSSDENN